MQVTTLEHASKTFTPEEIKLEPGTYVLVEGKHVRVDGDYDKAADKFIALLKAANAD